NLTRSYFVILLTSSLFLIFFFFNDTSPTEIYTLSLHDALPISRDRRRSARHLLPRKSPSRPSTGYGKQLPPHGLGRGRCPQLRRSEEHTSELQSPYDLVCRLLLEKKKKKIIVQSVDDMAIITAT